MKLRLVFAFLATVPGSILAHEVPGWKIENERGDVLVTRISTTSIAGDWCGIEPAKLTLKCYDDQLSLLIQSNCEPDAGPDHRTTVSFSFSGTPVVWDKEFEVLEDRKTLRLTAPFQEEGIFLNSFLVSSYGMGYEPTITASLQELNRPSRDIIFNVHRISNAVKNAGMQCSALSLFD
jgi:hypothetical protein